ncbi:MAG: CoA transferase [Pseudomonadota bacterium]
MKQRMPLEGIKVADFSWVQAGPWVGRFFANYGAEVIKVESATRVDWARNVPGEPATIDGKLNKGGLFANVNCDKMSVTLNLRNPRGIEIAKKLIARSDVVYDNFSSGVMKSYGLGYEEIKQIKPDIIMMEMPVFGFTGPYKSFSGYGPGIQAEIGLTSVTGFPGRPSGTGVNTAMPDMGPNPTHATVALLAALHYRNRTGKGQFIELAQFESSLCWMDTYLLDYIVNNRTQSRQGNRLSYAAPHGAYPCKGDDRWCVIAVFTEIEWMACCDVLGNPSWTTESRFLTLKGRKENEDALDNLIAQWTKERSPEDVMQLMQMRGVPAGVVENGEDMFHDKQMAARRYLITLDHPEGECLLENITMGFSETPGRIRRPGPTLGQDNEYVFKEILGMSEEEINMGYVDGAFD